jgi:hypothetical protein
MLNNLRVRASIRISTNFTLVMGSSPGFGSDTFDKRAINTRFRYGSIRKDLAGPNASTRWLILQ